MYRAIEDSMGINNGLLSILFGHGHACRNGLCKVYMPIEICFVYLFGIRTKWIIILNHNYK